MSATLNVRSDGMGSWCFDVIDPLLQRTFPHTRIVHDNTRAPDLVVRSHFTRIESLQGYTCPYIAWSGEAYPVTHLPDRAPLFELNTAHTGRENEVWFPHLVTEIRHTTRPEPVTWPKRWCCAFAFSNQVPVREQVFRRMRQQEPTCYGFGASCRTPDNPFELGRGQRSENGQQFREFGFCVAMENRVAPGYLTEKIGHAFRADTVPIYWGDTTTVREFFNPDTFVDVGLFVSPEAAADYAIEVWRDPQKLQRYLDAPLLLNDRLRDYEAIYTEYRPWQAPAVNALREAFPDRS